MHKFEPVRNRAAPKKGCANANAGMKSFRLSLSQLNANGVFYLRNQWLSQGDRRRRGTPGFLAPSGSVRNESHGSGEVTAPARRQAAERLVSGSSTHRKRATGGCVGTQRSI